MHINRAKSQVSTPSQLYLDRKWNKFGNFGNDRHFAALWWRIGGIKGRNRVGNKGIRLSGAERSLNRKESRGAGAGAGAGIIASATTTASSSSAESEDFCRLHFWDSNVPRSECKCECECGCSKREKGRKKILQLHQSKRSHVVH